MRLASCTRVISAFATSQLSSLQTVSFSSCVRLPADFCRLLQGRGGGECRKEWVSLQASDARGKTERLALKNRSWLSRGNAAHTFLGASSRYSGSNRSPIRFMSSSKDQGGQVLDFQSSRVVTNILAGEKLSEVNYLRSKRKMCLFIDEDGSKSNMTLEEVVKLADQRKLDPVMVAPDAEVPVLKILDFQKQRHTMKKQQKEQAKVSSALPLKEVRLGLNVGKGDLDRLMKQAGAFLEKGHRVKLFMRLKGKSFYTNQDQAHETLVQMAADLAAVGTPEGGGKAELVGRSTNIMLSPLKKKKNEKTKKGEVEEGKVGTKPDGKEKASKAKGSKDKEKTADKESSEEI